MKKNPRRRLSISHYNLKILDSKPPRQIAIVNAVYKSVDALIDVLPLHLSIEDEYQTLRACILIQNNIYPNPTKSEIERAVRFLGSKTNVELGRWKIIGENDETTL